MSFILVFFCYKYLILGLNNQVTFYNEFENFYVDLRKNTHILIYITLIYIEIIYVYIYIKV